MPLNNPDSPATDAPPSFQHVAAIDWSGAAGTRHKGIALAVADMAGGPPRLIPPPSPRGWARAEILDWLLTEAPPQTLAGFDMGLSLAHADRGAFFPGWPQTPPDARALWALVDALCAHEPDLGATTFADHIEASRHFRRHGNRRGDLFPAGTGRLRLTEHAQTRLGARPTSNFNLVGAAQVGKASLAGMRLLHRLPRDIPVWPVDPVPATPARLVVVEIWTTIAAIAAGRRAGASKMRDAADLTAALTALASPPAAIPTSLSDHAADALVTAAWLRRAAGAGALWSPVTLTPEIAHTEGWTFGVS